MRIGFPGSAASLKICGGFAAGALSRVSENAKGGSNPILCIHSLCHVRSQQKMLQDRKFLRYGATKEPVIPLGSEP